MPCGTAETCPAPQEPRKPPSAVQIVTGCSEPRLRMKISPAPLTAASDGSQGPRNLGISGQEGKRSYRWLPEPNCTVLIECPFAARTEAPSRRYDERCR